LALAVVLLPAPTLLAQAIVTLPAAATLPLDSTVDVLTLPTPARSVTPTEIRVKPFLTRDPEGLRSWRQQLQGRTETVPPTQDLIEDGAPPPSTPSPEASVTFSFDGLRDSDNAALTGFLYLPPDDNLGVGPSHIFEMVNRVGRVSDRLGANIASFTLRNLFGVDAVNETDPRVIYDASSGRWFGTYQQYSSFPAASGSSSVILIVSFTSDPTAGFCRYRVGNPGSEAFLQDFPHIGVSDDKVAISYNAFSFRGSPLGAGYYVISKGHLLACASAASFARVTPNLARGVIMPAQALGSPSDLFMAMHDVGAATTLTLLRLSGVPGVSAVIETSTGFGIGAWVAPPSAMQPGSGVRLETGDERVLSVAWQYRSLFVAGNAACTFPMDSATRSCVRLIEIRTDTSTIRQNVWFGASGTYYAYPALRPDGAGNLGIVFTRSSASEFASVRVTGRLVTDAPNTLQSSVPIQGGGGAQTHPSGRMGDYSGAALDPVDPSKVWVSGEYIRSTASADWGTAIAAIQLATPVSVFVSGFYQIVLGRIPDADGLAGWAAFVTANCDAFGFGTVGDAFFDSLEFRTSSPETLNGLVTLLYGVFLGRVPEPSGLAGWAGVFRGERVSLATGSFIPSAEFQSLVPNRHDPAQVTPVVTRFYTEILGRAPDPPGLAAWVNYIVATGDLEGAAAAFLTSPEFELRALTFRDYVRILYRTFLGREPDPVGWDGWESVLRGFLLGVVNGAFIPSAEFQGRIPLVCGS